MPVGKRGLLQEEKSKAKRSKSVTSVKTKLSQLDKIGYINDQWHSLYREIPEDITDLKKVVCKEVGSFLNGAGGILCFGCRSNGSVYGVKLMRKEEDNIRLIIDDTMKRFNPFLAPNKYKITFRSVDMMSSTRDEYFVMEIKVAPGNCCMYEDEFHEVYIRKNKHYKGPLSPHEIKELVTQLYYKRKKGLQSSSGSVSLKGGSSKPLAIIHPLERSIKASGCGIVKTSSIKEKSKENKPIKDKKPDIATTGESSTNDVSAKVCCASSCAKNTAGSTESSKSSTSKDSGSEGKLTRIFKSGVRKIKISLTRSETNSSKPDSKTTGLNNNDSDMHSNHKEHTASSNKPCSNLPTSRDTCSDNQTDCSTIPLLPPSHFTKPLPHCVST